MASKPVYVGSEAMQVRIMECKESSPRLQCPVYQHDPRSCSQSKGCFESGFPTIWRLHEHLKRCHSQKTRQKLHTSIPILSDDQFQKVSTAIHSNLRIPPDEKWRDIYMSLYPDATSCPTPFHPTLEGYVIENLRPSHIFKSRTIEKIEAGGILPEGADPELLFDLACQIAPLSTEAYVETSGRWGCPEEVSASPHDTSARNHIQPVDYGFQQAMSGLDGQGFAGMDGLDDGDLFKA